MPCITQTNLNPAIRARMEAAIKRLELDLAAGTVTAVIGATGAIAFKGWQDRQNVTDLCAYRKLAASNSPALRRAIMRAEAMAGRQLDQRAIAAGLHSHDGGATWGSH